MGPVTAMSIGLIGRKVGMTSVFQDDGTMVPVSVVAVEPNTITRLRTTLRDGYTAVQLGIEPSKRLSKPESGQLGDLPKVATIREFRVDSVDDYEVGQTLDVSLFAAGDLVDVTGVSKGKGFAGHMGDQGATIKKLRVVRTDPERNLVLVKGTLPGSRNALILLKKA